MGPILMQINPCVIILGSKADASRVPGNFVVDCLDAKIPMATVSKLGKFASIPIWPSNTTWKSFTPD